MGGEHLAIFDYDSLSPEEIADKIKTLARVNPAVDWDAIRDYETSTFDGGREAVISALDSADAGEYTEEEPNPADTGEPPEEKQQAGTIMPDEGQAEGGSVPTSADAPPAGSAEAGAQTSTPSGVSAAD